VDNLKANLRLAILAERSHEIKGSLMLEDELNRKLRRRKLKLELISKSCG
jgi:hypothetical protein